MRLQSALTVRSPVKNRVITALSFCLAALERAIARMADSAIEPGVLPRGYDGVQRVLPDSSFTRVWSVIQFTSQVLPPSSENDCSKWAEFGVMFDQTNRTRMALPLGPAGSVSKNSPRPFLNSPIVGGPMTPLLLVAQ